MGLLDLFGKKARQNEENEKPEDAVRSKIYPSMRVEVTTFDGQMLFIAKIQDLRGHTAKLHQYSEAMIQKDPDADPLHAKIRGFNDREKKAVYMEGYITPQPENIWHVEELAITDVTNDRAFFRLDTDLDATITVFSGPGAGEQPCKLLNISVGGACIGSGYEHHKDDKFLLKVRLLEDRPLFAMYCQVLRIVEKDTSKFEYGCRFLELTEADEDQIAQNIFTFQCKKRNRSYN